MYAHDKDVEEDIKRQCNKIREDARKRLRLQGSFDGNPASARLFQLYAAMFQPDFGVMVEQLPSYDILVQWRKLGLTVPPQWIRKSITIVGEGHATPSDRDGFAFFSFDQAYKDFRLDPDSYYFFCATPEGQESLSNEQLKHTIKLPVTVAHIINESHGLTWRLLDQSLVEGPLYTTQCTMIFQSEACFQQLCDDWTFAEDVLDEDEEEDDELAPTQAPSVAGG